MKMQAMIVDKPCTAEKFELKEVDRPQVRPGHLLVEIRATSVNPVDTKVRGNQLLFSPDYPAVLHMDFAGIIAEIPSDVTGFQVGDSVYGSGGGGQRGERWCSCRILTHRRPTSRTHA